MTLAGLALLAAGTIAAAQIVVPWVVDRRWAVGLCAGLLLLGAWRQPPQPGWPGDWVVLACDVVGRLVRQPYEISAGVVMGVVGSLLFLVLLLRRTS